MNSAAGKGTSDHRWSPFRAIRRLVLSLLLYILMYNNIMFLKIVKTRPLSHLEPSHVGYSLEYSSSLLINLPIHKPEFRNVKSVHLGGGAGLTASSFPPLVLRPLSLLICKTFAAVGPITGLVGSTPEGLFDKILWINPAQLLLETCNMFLGLWSWLWLWSNISLWCLSRQVLCLDYPKMPRDLRAQVSDTLPRLMRVDILYVINRHGLASIS